MNRVTGLTTARASGKVLMLHNPAGHPWPHPEPVDAESDDRQDPPFDVVPKEASARTVEPKSTSVDDRVVGLPPVIHRNRPGHSYA